MENEHPLLDDAFDVLQRIEETLSANDPYNNDLPADAVHLSDCEFPDHIDDPLALLREVLGEERTSHLEYLDDLELIADLLWDCVRRVQNRN
jgi:hypothetical protein